MLQAAPHPPSMSSTDITLGHDYLYFAALLTIAGAAFLEWARRRGCTHRALCAVSWLGALVIAASAVATSQPEVGREAAADALALCFTGFQ